MMSTIRKTDRFKYFRAVMLPLIGVCVVGLDSGCKPRMAAPSDVLANASQAAAAMKIIGKGDGEGLTGPAKGACANSSCHNIAEPLVRKWAEQTQQSKKDCFKSNMAAKETLDCLSNGNAGFYRAGIETAIFNDPNTGLFKKADYSATEITGFKNRVGMPQGIDEGNFYMNEQQFRVVNEWVLAGTPGLKEYFSGASSGAVEPLSDCTDSVSPNLKGYLARRNQDYWARRLVQQPAFQSYGCPVSFKQAFARDPIAAAQSCFRDAEFKEQPQWSVDSSVPAAQGEPWVTLKSRTILLKELPYKSYYWMRSSVDGRFIGNGFKGFRPGNESMAPSCMTSNFNAVVEDLRPMILDGKLRERIFVNGEYDPGFFPNNSGFTFHGIPTGRPKEVQVALCNMKLLTNKAKSACIDFKADEEAKKYCVLDGKVNVYQHVGSSFEGQDAFVVRGTYENDNAGFSVKEDPPTAKFASPNSKVDIFKFGASGDKLASGGSWSITKPFNGDWIIGPTSDLVVSRVSGPENVPAAQTVMQGYNIQNLSFLGGEPKLNDIGRVCLRGDKPGLSSNERILATHHYVAEADQAELGHADMEAAEFKSQYVSNSANLYIQDLCTGRKARITNMGPGQFAVFPHFRADGWLYFMVRDMKANKEYAVATDAALEMQKTGSCGG